jgi:hypothetical protein
VNYASSEQSQAVNTTPDSNIDKQNKHCRLEKKNTFTSEFDSNLKIKK